MADFETAQAAKQAAAFTTNIIGSQVGLEFAIIFLIAAIICVIAFFPLDPAEAGYRFSRLFRRRRRRIM